MNRIILVGFPGSGKSTVGKALAAFVNYRFVDLDYAIEAHYHTTIPAFFNKFGEEAFRICEYQVLKDVLKEEKIVLSTGGGTPCFFNAMELINRSGVSVYIKMPVQSLYNRLADAKRKRPLFVGKSQDELKTYIKALLEEREPVYRQASITVDGDNVDIPALAAQIQKLLYRL